MSSLNEWIQHVIIVLLIADLVFLVLIPTLMMADGQSALASYSLGVVGSAIIHFYIIILLSKE